MMDQKVELGDLAIELAVNNLNKKTEKRKLSTATRKMSTAKIKYTELEMYDENYINIAEGLQSTILCSKMKNRRAGRRGAVFEMNVHEHELLKETLEKYIRLEYLKTFSLL